MTIEVLNPTYGVAAQSMTISPRLISLAGARIAIVSNGKQGTGRFFDAVTAELRETHGVASVERFVKDNYSAPADEHIMDRVAEFNAVISGIGD